MIINNTGKFIINIKMDPFINFIDDQNQYLENSQISKQIILVNILANNKYQKNCLYHILNNYLKYYDRFI